ncbi:protein phosphatase 1F [Spea bombifrons]|uniref:protein phosphatase 1F n=1 Tax=Spea bombifrons TaxID=233779 RepID=UPI00234A3678|nr:protein phosphatase 1F [Spea bombifrons]
MEEADGATRDFLGDLLRDLPVQQEQLRSPNRRVSREEAEGELAEVLLRFLGSRGAPSWLSACLVQASVHQTLEADLSTFLLRNEAADSEEGEQENAERIDYLCSDSLLRRCLSCLQEISSQWQKCLPPITQPACQLNISAHAIRNTRRKMEDRHVAILEFNQLHGITDGVKRSYFAVFDGHGGVDAANYAAAHVHVNVARHESLAQDPGRALKESFQRTDIMFLQKAKRERLRSGTTGVCALLEGERLHVAWLGDSQALLVRQGKYVTLMDPHKPEREDERERIEAMGGCVAFMGCWRVNGTLAVSRAIGDIDQKPYVSGEGDVTSHVLDGSEDFLVLACDGFFDAVSPSEVPDLVFAHLQENGGDGQHVAMRLVKAAKDGGSGDNITVLVVFLRDPLKVLEDFLAQDSREGEPLFDFGGGVEVGSDHAG